jgi:hypothetical protein
MARGRALVIAIGVGIFVIGLAVAGERLTLTHKVIPPSRPLSDSPWAGAIARIDRALAARDVSGAELAWNEAYSVALGSPRWNGMIEVGDASARIGAASYSGDAAVARARQAYLIALFCAREAGSVEGVLRAGEVFEKLGDHEVAEVAAQMAGRLASQSEDVQARARVYAFAVRVGPSALSAAGLRSP